MVTVIYTHPDKIAALDHEVLNDPMEAGTFVTDGHAVFTMLPGAELTEILTRFGTHVSV